MMTNIFYTYAYLRKSNNTPYYIGKGKDRRAYEKSHNVSVPKDKSRIVFLETNLSEIGALALERRMISWYGRKDINTGILRNQTAGGEGSSGRVVSEESRKKQVATRRKNDNYGVTETVRNKISVAVSAISKGVTKSEEHRINIGKAKEGNKNPMFGKDAWNKGMTGINLGAKEKITCPHCEKEGGKPVMMRHHFDNCKSLSLVNESIVEKIHGNKGRQSHFKGKNKEENMCPHCFKIGGHGAMQRWHFDNCKDNKDNKNKLASTYAEIACPHCNKTGRGGNMMRYHFDNCKMRVK